MRVKAEDILKPGAVLVVEKIDFNDSEVQKFFRYTRMRQRAVMKYKELNREILNLTINI